MLPNIDDKVLITTLIVVSLILGFISTTGVKTQFIRLVDVFVIGPVMIYAGYIGYIEKRNLLYLLLIFFGGTTITYNLKNFMYASK